jgi:hypothetical protein
MTEETIAHIGRLLSLAQSEWRDAMYQRGLAQQRERNAAGEVARLSGELEAAIAVESSARSP